MLGLSNIPTDTNHIQTFFPIATNAWQTWTKPSNAKLVQIFCLGGGGSGLPGGGGSTGGNVQGGGGGTGGGYVNAIFPAYVLPGTLYIRPGLGGSGTPNGGVSTGNVGQVSFVSIGPTGSTALYYPILVASSLTTAPAGGGLSAATGPAATTTAVAPFLSLAIYLATSGPDGGFGLTDLTALATRLNTGGAGGGLHTSNTSISNPGGIISGSTILLTVTQPRSPVNLAGGGNQGGLQASHGYGSLYPYYGVGGNGGGGSTYSSSTDTPTGSRGGDGWYGCGGGGGGAGWSANRRGGAGRGGDGLVTITTIF